MEGPLINCSKQSREQNPSARRGQLGRIRGADPGQIGGDLCARRCIVSNGNPMPGYRDEQEAERMDSRQKIQNGRGVSYGGVSRANGHSLMSMVSLVLLAMLLVLPHGVASDPCSQLVEVSEEWRDVSVTQGINTIHCDEKKFSPDSWYSFSLGGEAASIPTQCIKNNMCGSKVAMRVDLIGQSVPKTVGENITAVLCGSYDVLGKYDCCVLRSQVNIIRCEKDVLAYNFPSSFDRCPVAVCAQGKDSEVPREAVARMGQDVSSDDVVQVTDTTLAEVESTVVEVTTTARDDPDSSLSLDEISSTHIPPQPLMQQTTDSVSSDSVSEDHISSTEESASESISSAIPTEISDIAETKSEDQTTTVRLETDSVAQTNDDFTDLNSEEPSTELVTSTSSLSPMTSSLLTSTEKGTTDTTTSQITSENVTSDKPVDSSRDDSLLSSTTTSFDNTSSSSRDHSSSDVPSARTTPPSDLLTTADTLTDLNSTTSRLDEATSDIVQAGNDTDVSVTNIPEFSETKSTESFMEKTTDSRITEIRDTEIVTTLYSDLTSTTVTLKPAVSANTTQASTTTIKTTFIPREPLSTRAGIPDVSKLPHKDTVDVKLIETVRLVFKSENGSVLPVKTVVKLLGEFLERVSHDLKVDDFDWTYQLLNVSDAINFENRKTFIDFEIMQTANDLRKISEITDIFTRFQLRKFISEQTNMTLIAECRVKKNCQYDSFEGTPQGSVFQENAPALITVIVLCSVCLFILVVVLLYAHLSKRGSWKAPDTERNAENRRKNNGNQSPFTDAQIMKDEMVDDASVNDSAKDGDTNLSNTWVIPLDQDPNSQKVEIAIATQDTKF